MRWDSLFSSQLIQENLITDQNDSTFINLKEIFGTRDLIEARITKEMQALHMIYGLPLNNVSTEFPIIIAGINGVPTPSFISTHILEEDENYLVVKITNRIDSNSMKGQVTDFVETINSGNTQENNSSSILINDTCLTYFNKKTEIPYYVEYWRTVRIDSINTKLHITIDQK